MPGGPGQNTGAVAEIVLVRHAESEANLSAAWQGRGDAALSATGKEQVAALAERVDPAAYDAVLSSPLSRAVDTASAFSDSPEMEEDLIEVDLGSWEGISFDVVAASDRALLEAIYGGADQPFGQTGERLSEVAARAWAVIDDLAERIGPQGRAAVVTHGGVIDSVLATLMPMVKRRPHRMAANASLTHLVGGPERWRLARFNDTAHLGKLPAPASAYLSAGEPVLAFIRHGRTKANIERRMQGQSCWGLDEIGRSQVGWLAGWYGPLSRVYTSPLERARSTAAALSTDPIVVEGLSEMSLGEWEGLTWPEVEEGWADLHRQIYEEGLDLARGVTGETWAQATERIVAAVDSLDAPGGEVTGVVSHGGVIRAYVGTLGGDPASATFRLAVPDNTSVTHIALTDSGPVLCDYAVAPHLEGAVLPT